MTAEAPGGRTLEISVPVDGEAAEAVCELFERYGGGAVVETRPRDDGPGETWVRTYLPESDVDARLRVEVGLWHLGRIVPLPEALVRTLSEANWAEHWKAHFTPLRIGRLVIAPTWSDDVAIEPGDVEVRLDPGMAFGTGLHPTTRLCLAALEETVRPGTTVLDVGTGSGILAVAAARLGAGPVAAVDIDPRAAEIANDNAARNAVAIDARPGELDAAPAGPFDLVLANLLAPTLVVLAPALAARLAPRGLLVASGVLDEQADGVVAALSAAGLPACEVRADGDWTALLARR